jgi:PAS domain S-box-containing protein
MYRQRSAVSQALIKLDSPISMVSAATVTAALCYLAAAVGGVLVLRPQMLWPVWPGCALLVALLLLAESKVWPILAGAGFAGFLMCDLLTFGMPFRFSGILVLADTIEVFVAAVGLRYCFGYVIRLESIASFAKYFLVAVILAPICAAFVSAAAFQGTYWIFWRSGVLTEGLAFLTVTPAILGLAYTVMARRSLSTAYYLEATAIMVGLFICGYFTFASSTTNRPEMLYSLIPFLLWSALRFGAMGTCISLVVVAFVAMWGAVHGHGPFVGQGTMNDVFSLQLFLLFAATPFMFLAALVDGDKQAKATIQESETRYRRIVETANEGIWLLDSELHTSYVNRQMAQMLGYELKEMIGQSVFDFYFPEDVESKKQALGERQKGQREQGEERLRRRDGSELWVRMAASPLFNNSGEFEGALAMMSDVTERKRAEEILHESEQRFCLVASTAPVMIWMSGPDQEPTYFNQRWLDFTGLSEAELKNGLAGIVHAEDYQRCHDAYCRGFDQRQPFRKECRLRRYDGQYRWMLDIGVPRFHKDGSFAGYIGSCVDVTDHKLAEEALSGMSRKLVEAQEQERARIARELHDDICQRLALLTIDLDQIQQNWPDLPAEVLSRVLELRQQTRQISAGVQSLSHDLHSSQLEYLGVVRGMESWCVEFGKRRGIYIDCSHNVRSTLSTEIGICLFRVLQEALHNAAKYSGVKRVKVELSENENSGEIHLTITDLGKGFDLEGAKQGRGLGLTSMRERVRLVNGMIEIQSKPMDGTTIHVRVPFHLDSNPQPAAGL